jgi:hypothetical protein
MNPRLIQFFEELNTHPDIPYQPWGEGLAKIIPGEFKVERSPHIAGTGSKRLTAAKPPATVGAPWPV